MSEEVQLANIFISRLKELKDKKGDIGLTDIRLLVEELTQKGDQSLYEKVLAIAVKIHHLRDEFAHIDTDKIAESANSRLEAVVQATEDATHSILDCASEIQEIAGSIEEQAMREKIQLLITKIFEACNFQDLTGQHINSVVKTMVDVETLVKSIIKVLPEDFKNSVKGGTMSSEDDELLQGPQLSDQIPTQDEIDKIFAES